MVIFKRASARTSACFFASTTLPRRIALARESLVFSIKKIDFLKNTQSCCIAGLVVNGIRLHAHASAHAILLRGV